MPGHYVEFILSEECTEIVVFHDLSTSKGMVKVEIDGAVLREKNFSLPIHGVLDGRYPGSLWLPKDREQLQESVIAQNLELKQHSVCFTILIMTHSEVGTHKFDFSSIACRR